MNPETLLPVLAELLVKSSAVLLLAALLVRLWRGANSAQRHFIWLATLGTIMVLPATRLIAPRWAIPIEPAQKASAITLLEALPPIVEEEAPALTIIPTVSSARPSAPTPIPWRKIVLAVWLSGIGLILGYRLVGSWRLHRLRRRSTAVDDPRIRLLLNCTLSELGLRRRPEVRLSAECRVPVTWGWLRPVLLLPREALGWSDTWLTAALRHEAAHILRGDSLTRWAAWLACAVYWPNPFIWLAAHALRIAQEQAADDLVLHHGTPPEEYAAQLVAVARTVATHGVFLQHAVAMASPSTLEGRILAIVDGQRDRRPLSRLAALVGAASALLALALCTAAQLQGADASRPKEQPIAPETPGAAKAPQIEIYTKFIEISSDAPEPVAGMTFEQQTVLSDPQLQVVIRALNQKKGVDLLSAPNLTTRSGVDSRIEITRDFAVKNLWPQKSASPEPTDSETKKVGVIMDITPEVKAGGEIALRLQPSYTEFSGFQDLDDPSHFPLANPAGKRIKPVFGEAKQDLNVTLHSGETVVFAMGDLKVDGKSVPANAQRPRRHLVFVSARVIEPAPQPVAEAPSEQADAARRGEADAAQIVIPKVEFREATVPEAFEFLRAKSRELNTSGKPIEIAFAMPPERKDARITISLTNVPLSEATRYIASLAELPVKFAPGMIIVGAPGAAVVRPSAEAKELSPEDSPAGRKALAITFPKVAFREVSVQEAVDYLRLKAKEIDPEHAGVNIVLKLPAAPPADRTKPNPLDARLTIDLTNIPLYEALRYVAGLSELQLVTTPDALLLQPAPGAAATPPGAPAAPPPSAPFPLDPPAAAPKNAQTTAEPQTVITVDKSRGVKWNDEAVSEEALQDKLRELRKTAPATSVVLRGDADTPYKTVMELFEKIRHSGLETAVLAIPGDLHAPFVTIRGNNTITLADGAAAPSAPASGEPRLFTKEWKIDPQWVPEKPAGSGTGPISAREWLTARGIVLEGGATALFIPKTNRLIVRNTQAQLDLVDALIEGLQNEPGKANAAAPADAAKAPEKPLGIEADSTRMENGVAIAEGHVKLTWDRYRMTANTVCYTPATKTVHLTGQVEIANELNVIQGDDVEITLQDGGHISIKGPHKTTIRTPPSASDKRSDDLVVKGFSALLQGEQLSADGKAAEAQEKLREAQEALKRLQVSDAALASRLKALQQRLAELKSGQPGPLATRPILEGRVIAVNQEKKFVVITVGEQKGATTQSLFNVFRGQQAIARVRITNVEPTTSVADILPESIRQGFAIQPGDTVLPEGAAPGDSPPNFRPLDRSTPAPRTSLIPADPPDAGDAFVTAYLHVQKSGRLEEKGDIAGALREMQAAAKGFEDITKNFPSWQPQILVYRKMRTAEAIQRLQGASPRAAAPGAALELKAIRVEEKADEAFSRHLALHIPVKRAGGATIDPQNMVVHVLFYDMIDGQELKQTVAEVNSHWDNPPANWAERDVEELVVDYRLPKAAAVTDQGGTRQYYGYLVRLYYGGQLQGNSSDQPRLLQQYPSPARLPGGSPN